MKAILILLGAILCLTASACSSTTVMGDCYCKWHCPCAPHLIGRAAM